MGKGVEGFGGQTVGNGKRHSMAIYTQGSRGLLDELVFDIYNKWYIYNGNIDERDLIWRQHNYIKEFRVDEKLFNAFFRLVEEEYSGEYWDEEIDYDTRKEDEKKCKAERAKRPTLAKEKAYKALRGALSGKELEDVCGDKYRYEKHDYYDFELIMSKIHSFMHGDITLWYFSRWRNVLYECLCAIDCKGKALREVYEHMAWDFNDIVADGDVSGEYKAPACRWLIARTKYFNHVIRDLKKGTSTDFTTSNVITYVSIGQNVGGTRLFRVCVVDKTLKRINYMFVPDIDYKESINYTFLSEAEFDDLFNIYHSDYVLDCSIGHKYAAKAAKRR